MTTFEKVSVREEDAIRLILEFLSRRELCISQLSLERESGITNCNVGDDLIFLRQLILDGQWEDALQFVTPLQSLEHFASQQFHFLIYKHKYVELLCIRAEASASSVQTSVASVEVAVQDIIDCLNELERYCPSREDYHRLSSLLTIPSLSDDEELRNWNPNSWRLKCFHDVMPLVERFMQQQQPATTTASDTASNSSGTNHNGNSKSGNCIARNDRLMNLIFKGLMYEVCLETVAQKMALTADGNQCTTIAATTTFDPDVMNGVESTFNLHSFLQSVPAALLAAYKADRAAAALQRGGSGEEANRCSEPPIINLDIEKHDKPLLVASWSEMILAAPIKPNVFPHTQVPFTRIKAADLMSKSLSASLMKSASAKDMMAMSVCDIAQFSRSTLASTGFHLNKKDDDEEEEKEATEEEDKENNTWTRSTSETNKQPHRSQPEQPLTTTATNCDNVMNTSVDRLFRSADAFTSSKGLQLTPKEAAAAGALAACSDRMPTITELATPTTPSTEAGAEFASFASPTNEERPHRDDEMNESYLDIWMRSQHQRLKKNKLNRTLSNRLNSSGGSRRPPSLAGAVNTASSASVKRTAAATFTSGGGLAASARKHSTASWSASKSSSITQQQQRPATATMPSASGPASTVSSGSSSSTAATTTTTGEAVSAGRAASAAAAADQLGHMTHNSNRFVSAAAGATPAKITNITNNTMNTRPLTSTPLKWLPGGGGGGGATAANSIRRELFAFDDDRSALRNSPITCEERNYGSGGGRQSTVAADGGNYGYGSNSNKHGLRSSLSSPSSSHSNQHSSQHTSHQHSVDLSTASAAANDTEAIRFVSVANFEDQQAIRTAEFHPSGRYFAIGSNSKQLRVFQYSSQDSNNNTADSLSDISPPELIFKRPRYHKGSIYCLAWNKIGNLLATGSNDKTIKLITFNPESQRFLNNEVELPVHDGTVRDLCFMDDLTNGSSLLLSGGAGDCKINITDCETATTFLSLSGHSGPVLSLYTWGGAMFVSGSQDRTIRFWDLRSNSCINFVTCPTISRTKPGGAVAAVSVDPTGKLLVSGHEDSTCMLYDVRGGRVIQTFHPHSADIRTLRFSSKAYYLLSGGYDNKIVLTDMQGDLTQPLKSVVVAEHDDKVIQCRWHPTEFVFLSTSADKTAKLWALPD